MLRKIYRNYKKIFDEKLDNSTLLIVLIAFLIILIWIFVPTKWQLAYSKNNLLEASRIGKLNNNKNIIEINWKKYYINLTEVE